MGHDWQPPRGPAMVQICFKCKKSRMESLFKGVGPCLDEVLTVAKIVLFLPILVTVLLHETLTAAM